MVEAVVEYDDLLDGTGHRWRGRLILLAVALAILAGAAYGIWALLLRGGRPGPQSPLPYWVTRG